MTVANMGSEGYKWFLGIVEDLADPLQLGRVRVRIFAEHDDNIQTTDLPWAIVFMPPTSASLGSVGSSPNGLLVGSYVKGFYLDGAEKQFPAVDGTWHKIPNNDKDQHDVASLARGKNNIQKTLLGPEPDTPYAAQYPHNKVLQTPSGHTIEMDDTPGHERIHIYHSSGTYAEINNNGRLVIKSANDSFQITAGNNNVYVAGKANVHIEGSEDVYIGGNNDVTIHGNMTVDVTGAVSIRSGAAIALSAPGGVTVSDGSLTVAGTVVASRGATGTFTTPTGETVHVQNGIITNIF